MVVDMTGGRKADGERALILRVFGRNWVAGRLIGGHESLVIWLLK
jgi:hypothetical protein